MLNKKEKTYLKQKFQQDNTIHENYTNDDYSATQLVDWINADIEIFLKRMGNKNLRAYNDYYEILEMFYKLFSKDLNKKIIYFNNILKLLKDFSYVDIKFHQELVEKISSFDGN